VSADELPATTALAHPEEEEIRFSV